MSKFRKMLYSIIAGRFMHSEILKALHDWNPWIDGVFPQELGGFARDFYHLEQYLQIPEIKILEGARRTGKSTLLYQIIEKVLRKGNEVLYVNFEDEILKKYTLQEIISAYKIESSVKNLFVDEIQNCKDWVAFLRKAYDRKEINQIWISGSNSSFIKKEFATLLTGRNIAIKVFPLSFAEFVQFKSIVGPFSTEKEILIQQAFSQYLNFGAFPAVVLRSVLQKELLINYFEDFIYKDIAFRHDVNLIKIKELGIYLATNVAKSFSYRACANALGMHANTITDYCSYFYEIFLFYELYKFDYSLKNQIGTDKKIYIVDTGLGRAVSFRFSEDMGRGLENIVCNELRRRGLEIYYHKQKFECDFLIKKELQIVQAIQVSLSLNDPDVKEREMRGLLEAMETYGLKSGLILTLEEDGIQEGGILILPIWKWLLSPFP